MPRELVEISLSRSGPSQPWGFRIVGGRDEGLVCRVEKVRQHSAALVMFITSNSLLLMKIIERVE